jgi:hypothetical protein
VTETGEPDPFDVWRLVSAQDGGVAALCPDCGRIVTVPDDTWPVVGQLKATAAAHKQELCPK